MIELAALVGIGVLTLVALLVQISLVKTKDPDQPKTSWFENDESIRERVHRWIDDWR